MDGRVGAMAKVCDRSARAHTHTLYPVGPTFITGNVTICSGPRRSRLYNYIEIDGTIWNRHLSFGETVRAKAKLTNSNKLEAIYGPYK